MYTFLNICKNLFNASGNGELVFSGRWVQILNIRGKTAYYQMNTKELCKYLKTWKFDNLFKPWFHGWVAMGY